MESTPPHLIRELQQLTSAHPMTLDEGLQLTERQASLLLTKAGMTRPVVSLRRLARLLNIEVRMVPDLAVPGMAEFVHGRWLILIRGNDHFTRRRFTLAGEFWRVLAAGHADFLGDERTARQWARQCGDHFAACLLMPRGWVYEAWAQDVHEVSYLAGHFLVSKLAMTQRLHHLGLTSDHYQRPCAAYCAA